MYYDFEGKTEEEAIENAIKELGLDRDQIDVEILESEKSGPFNFQKTARIRVYLHDNEEKAPKYRAENSQPENDFESDIISCLEELISKLGYDVSVSIMYREEHKLALSIDSKDSSILIGKKGKNLDALQLLINSIANRRNSNYIKIILDIENYRVRRENSLIQLAHRIGDQVIRNHKTQILEPMTAYDRRLIHTALNDIESLETISEGTGQLKKIHIRYKGFDS